MPFETYFNFKFRSFKKWEQQKSKRMLVLELTDGVINIRGMEYQPIPVLNADLPPGTKVPFLITY